MRILVVEDEPKVASFIARALREDTLFTAIALSVSSHPDPE
jgi:DNA-binding response OmpR family regulator